MRVQAEAELLEDGRGFDCPSLREHLFEFAAERVGLVSAELAGVAYLADNAHQSVGGPVSRELLLVEPPGRPGGGAEVQLAEELAVDAAASGERVGVLCVGDGEQPEYGSVVASKRQLAGHMADLILEDLRARGADAVSEERPIIAMIVAVFRVT